MTRLHKMSKKNNKMFFKFLEFYLGPKKLSVLLLEFSKTEKEKWKKDQLVRN